ncbi:MAG: ATP-binding cassette domain-containing protein [Deltaproteobacteria bacterium]|nr:ATP-binding cassette domain-containing protein [Deltaproteobacteria bacterium]
MKLIELHDIHKTYQMGQVEVPVLKGVSFEVGRGEFVALMGASGSGKTTLMNILGCLDRPTSGSYRLAGQEVTDLSADDRAQLRNQKLGFVFQTFNLLPRTSALENVLMPLSYNGVNLSDDAALRRSQELLQRVGLGERLDHEPSQLSGGQQQRVAIARALVNHPTIVLADEPTGNLDSKTSVEVLELVQRLNDEGVTIILVTHDEAVARYAKRIIRISDGMVEADTGGEAASPETPASEDNEADRSSHWNSSRLHRLVRTALHGLRRNIMRAALTALGIIIGVAAVIAMMEIGRGSASAINRTIASMGADNLLVLPGTAASGGVSFGIGTATTLTPQDAEAILKEAPAVRAVAPVVRARTQIIYGNRNWVPIYVYGSTPTFLDVRQWPLAAGEVFTEQDVRNGSKVCLLGQRLVRELFQGEDPLNKEIRVNNITFKVIGILSAKGANMMGVDQDDILLAPWTTIRYRVSRTALTNVNQSAQQTTTTSGTTQQVNTLNRLYPSTGLNLYPAPSASQAANNPLPVRFANVDQIIVAARSTQETPLAIRQITQLLRERHRLREDAPDDFQIRDMTEMTSALSSTATLMTKLLLAVALISLVVGGVGIMNIMLVSVTERTREIGLRLAVGAWSRDILQQFLTEAVLLCFCGGIVGILLGRGISILIRGLLQWPTELSVAAILVAFAVSVTVGVIFGYYPAWKASRLDPINALRYE